MSFFLFIRPQPKAMPNSSTPLPSIQYTMTSPLPKSKPTHTDLLELFLFLQQKAVAAEAEERSLAHAHKLGKPLKCHTKTERDFLYKKRYETALSCPSEIKKSSIRFMVQLMKL